MGHRLGTADQACDITDEERREDQTAIAVDPSGDRAQDVVKNTQSVQHAAHSDRETDDRHILQHAAHTTTV